MSVRQENTRVTSLVPFAITLKDPSGVFAGEVFLKMENINVQVTLQSMNLNQS